MKKTGVLIWLCLSIKTLCFSQEKLFKATLPPVPENGFYKINLRPEIVSAGNPDFSDIRLYDQKKKEIPYLLERTQSEKTTRYFRDYPVISKKIIPAAATILVIQNPKKNKINNLGLVIKNTGVRKKASLSGSADAQNWYALEDDYELQSVANPEETSDLKVLHFPLSDYEYYKLEINDSVSAPLNILAAGYYDFSAENGQYETINELTYKRTDSAKVKKTYLWFTAKNPVLIDKLEFQIDSATFYLRNATVFVQETVVSRRGKKTKTWVPAHQFELKTAGQNAVRLQGLRAKNFYIEIENADNPPLEISSVKAYQLRTFLLAELKKGRNYELQFGDEKAHLPSYDLAFFKDKIPENLPVLEPQAIVKNATSQTEKSAINKFFQHEALIWIAILAVIAFLGYMTFQMLKESSHNKSSGL